MEEDFEYVGDDIKLIKELLLPLFKSKPESLQLYEVLLRNYFNFLPNKGFKITEKEWDYLIVLDACRFDYFQKINDLKGKLKKAYSLGSSTLEWRNKNFTRKHKDIIYVSANPFISNIKIKGFNGSHYFYKVYDVWKNGWNNKLHSVHPKEINKEAIQLTKEYPKKRLIIHYIQPHYPFVGSDLEFNLDMRSGKNQIEGNLTDHRAERYRQLMFDKQRIKKMKQAYIDNLRFVLEYVKKLVSSFKGKIVVTADHGEAFGNKGIFAHPGGIHIKTLIEVPWLTIYKE